MAIKREKRQVSFENRIGVNRGAGYTFAASQKQSQAQAFDKIVDVIANESLKNLQEEGKKFGTEQGLKEVFATEVTENGTIIPILPEIPDYLGKTAKENYEKLIYNRYESDVKGAITNTIRNIQGQVSSQRGKPDVYKKQAQIEIGEILDNVAPKFRQLMESHATETMDQYEYGVITAYESGVRSENNLKHEEISDNIRNSRIGDIFTGKGNNPKHRDDFITSLESTSITSDRQKELIKRYDDTGKAYQYVYKTFGDIIYAKDGRTTRLKNSANNVTQLINFINTPGIEKITINGKTYNSADRDKFIKDEKVRKDITSILKDYKKYAKQHSKKHIDTTYFDNFNLDFNENQTNDDWVATNTLTVKQTQDFFAEMEPDINLQYNSFAKKNNLQETNGRHNKDSIKYYLRKFKMAPTNVHDSIITSLDADRIPNKDVLNNILTTADYYKQYGYNNAELKGINKTQQHKILTISSLHEMNGFDPDITLEKYKILVDARTTMTPGQRLPFVQDQDFVSTGTYFVEIGNEVIKDLDDYSSVPALVKFELGTAMKNHMLLANIGGSDETATRKKLKDYAKQALDIIIGNTDVTNINEDSFLIGESNITANNGMDFIINDTSFFNSDKKRITLNPIERIHGINNSDFTEHPDTPFMPEIPFKDNIDYIYDLLAEKMGRNSGYYLDTNGVTSFNKVLDVRNVKLLANKNFLYHKNNIGYTAVIQQESEENVGVKQYNHIALENEQTESTVVITYQEIQEAKKKYIEKIIEEEREKDGK